MKCQKWARAVLNLNSGARSVSLQYLTTFWVTKACWLALSRSSFLHLFARLRKLGTNPDVTKTWSDYTNEQTNTKRRQIWKPKRIKSRSHPGASSLTCHRRKTRVVVGGPTMRPGRVWRSTIPTLCHLPTLSSRRICLFKIGPSHSPNRYTWRGVPVGVRAFSQLRAERHCTRESAYRRSQRVCRSSLLEPG